MTSPINKIAAEISTAFTDILCTPGARKWWVHQALPFVYAMLEVESAEQFYGIDRAEDILLEFLHIVGEHWHGPQSDRVRAQLREHLYKAKEYHASHKS